MFDGIPIFLVGGAVRDRLLGLPCKDRDYVVGVATFAELTDWAQAQDCRVWLSRPEHKIIRAGHPVLGCADFTCLGGETLEDNLRQRDFTINAMALQAATADQNQFGTLFDPFQGKADLETGVLQCPGDALDAFQSDPVRIVRMLRFSLQFNLDITPRTKQAAKRVLSAHHYALPVAPDRVVVELNKMLLAAKSLFHFSTFVNRHADILEHVLTDEFQAKGVGVRHREV